MIIPLKDAVTATTVRPESGGSRHISLALALSWLLARFTRCKRDTFQEVRQVEGWRSASFNAMNLGFLSCSLLAVRARLVH